MKEIERGRTEYYQSLGTPPGLPTMKGHYSEPEETNRPLPNIVLGNYDLPKNWPTPPKFSEPGAPPGPPIQWQPNTPQTAASGYGYVPAAEPEREVFFYHSDHLGSTAYITDRNGAVSQFICYMPYGEALVDEHSASAEEQPYKFNGKEMDRETGLYYYGARYYDPSKSGVWYGIDPLTEKYPALSPYSYCAGNPVKYVDPDGRVIKIGSPLGRVLAFFGTDNFENKTQKKLQDLKALNPEMRSAIERMEKSDHEIKILPAGGKFKSTKGTTRSRYINKNIKQGSSIYYNPDKNITVEGVEVSPKGVLAHELGHSDNLLNGTGTNYDKSKARNSSIQSETERIKGNQSERKSIRFENYVRKSERKPERSYEYYKKNKD